VFRNQEAPAIENASRLICYLVLEVKRRKLPIGESAILVLQPDVSFLKKLFCRKGAFTHRMVGFKSYRLFRDKNFYFQELIAA
jgi:hypothetical protein